MRLRTLRRRARGAFTLIELLVVVAVIGVLVAALLPALAAARAQADRVVSANNMRSLAVALEVYLGDNGQDFPSTSHGNPDLSSAWVYTLAPYLEDARRVEDPDDPAESVWRLGRVRVCPRDPKSEERFAAGGTSYMMNEFVTVPHTGPFGGIDWSKTFTNRRRLDHPSQTYTMFVGAGRWGVDATNDHTHSRSWSDWDTVAWDIAPSRFGGSEETGLGGSSLYLFADNHIEHTPASELKALIDDGVNFATPPR